jgi:uncharacterized membrane protein
VNLIKNIELLKIILLFFILISSAYLLFMTYTGYLGLFFGFVFVLSVILILVDIFTIPIVKEKFFSGIVSRKKKEEISEDTSSLVLKRANYKCQNCGAPGNRIYHMDRKKSHNDPNNLLVLCDKCIVKVEDGTIPSDQVYFMRSREKKDRQK